MHGSVKNKKHQGRGLGNRMLHTGMKEEAREEDTRKKKRKWWGSRGHQGTDVTDRKGKDMREKWKSGWKGNYENEWEHGERGLKRKRRYRQVVGRRGQAEQTFLITAVHHSNWIIRNAKRHKYKYKTCRLRLDQSVFEMKLCRLFDYILLSACEEQNPHTRKTN